MTLTEGFIVWSALYAFMGGVYSWLKSSERYAYRERLMDQGLHAEAREALRTGWLFHFLFWPVIMADGCCQLFRSALRLVRGGR